MATSVVISSSALARERSRSETSSGTMEYFAGLKTVECTAIRNSTTNIQATLWEKKTTMPSAITAISKILTAIRTRALADGVGKLAGVSGEQQRWQHEDGAGEGEILAALVGLRDDVHRAEGDDDAVGVIVERAEELGPEEGQEAVILQDVFESAVCHARYRCTASARAPVCERYHGSMG